MTNNEKPAGLAAGAGQGPGAAETGPARTAKDRDGLRACAWCGRRFPMAEGPGRPRKYCRRSCRQRDFEARDRARELGLAESDLIVTRTALEQLDDLVYVLSCAVEDVERDLAADDSADELRRALRWLLDAARPLATAMPGQRLRT